MVVDTKGSFIITKYTDRAFTKQRLINGKDNGSRATFKEKGSR